MTTDDTTGTAFSLRRWSRKKLEAARGLPDAGPDSGRAALPVAAPAPPAEPRAAEAAVPAAESAPLPPVDSLTIDSDFSAFLHPKVDDGIRRQALKQLFRDPHFNVMDGLDVYIDDYSKSDPIAPEIVRRLVQGRYIFDPPKTRVGADGSIEDVPDEAPTAAPAPEPQAEAAALPPAVAPSPPPKAVPDVPGAEPSTTSPPGRTGS
jgi:hypothetical protein